MYDVTVKNDYDFPLALDHPDTSNLALLIGLSGIKAFQNQRNHLLSSPAMGPINFIDITDKKLSEYVNQSLCWPLFQWDCWAGYRKLDNYFRFAGRNEVVAENVPHGCLH